MNFRNILQEISKTDPEIYDRLSSRRQVFGSFGSKVAAVALPLAVSSMFKKAYGKTSSSVIEILNYALELEYFEFNFYHTANNTGALIPASDLPGYLAIEEQEKAHVNFLRATINNLGSVPFTPKYYTGNPVTGNPYAPASYDFTAGGKYDIYHSYPVFTTLAEAFEDVGVRAYIGQAENLLPNQNDLLVQLMQISVVEARHAAWVRHTRRQMGELDYPKPWITKNAPPAISLQPYYLGEDNQTQRGVEITQLPTNTGTVPKTAATEAFDEPMNMATITNLITPFILP